MNHTHFFNGKGFAEVCVTIHAYVTEEDRAKFKPEKLEKKYCDADEDMTTAQLIAYVKEEAVVQSLIEYNPKLKGADKESLLQLVQKVSYLESGFIPDTQTYCAKFAGYVTPIEISAFLEGAGTDENHNSTSSCSEWNLSSDFRNLPDHENPHSDSCGNLKVWHLMQSTTLSRDPQSYSLLTSNTSTMFGVQGLRGWNGVYTWGGYGFPIIGVNATGILQHPVTANWPPDAVFVHPPPSQLGIVGWHSPIDATIKITGSVSDADGNCGDGILWFIDKGNKNLASGKYTNGGVQDFGNGTGDDTLMSIPVVEGDFIYFIIHPAGGFTCDSTLLDVSITVVK